MIETMAELLKQLTQWQADGFGGDVCCTWEHEGVQYTSEYAMAYGFPINKYGVEGDRRSFPFQPEKHKQYQFRVCAERYTQVTPGALGRLLDYGEGKHEYRSAEVSEALADEVRRSK